MTFEEKRAWVTIVVTVASYITYAVVVLGRAGDVPLPEVPYVAPLLWTIGGAIVGGIVLGIVVGILGGREGGRTDVRDREINRFGEYIGNSFVVIGAVSGLVLALLEAAYFWIANAIYLAFALAAVLGSVTKIVSYRRGFQPW